MLSPCISTSIYLVSPLISHPSSLIPSHPSSHPIPPPSSHLPSRTPQREQRQARDQTGGMADAAAVPSQAAGGERSLRSPPQHRAGNASPSPPLICTSSPFFAALPRRLLTSLRLPTSLSPHPGRWTRAPTASKTFPWTITTRSSAAGVPPRACAASTSSSALTQRSCRSAVRPGSARVCSTDCCASTRR